MSNLYDAGYESDQISQILKIEETGFNIRKHVNCNVSADKLRRLRTLLNGDYTKKEKILITKFIVEEDKDVTAYVKRGIALTSQIRLIEDAKAAGYDETLFNSKFDFLQMKLLYKYLKQGIDISKYLLEQKTKETIERIVKLEKAGIKYDDFKEFKTQRQQEALMNAINQKINPLPYLNSSASVSQINAVTDAIKKGVDVKKVTKVNVPGSVMEIITKGLLEGYDITPYIEEDTKRQYAEVILKGLKNGFNVTKCYKYKDHKLCRLAMQLDAKGISIDFLDDARYNFNQLSTIGAAYEMREKNSEIEVEKILDPEYPVEQMQCIINLMTHKKKIDDLIIKDVNIGVLRIIEDNNLKDIYFDGLIHPNMGIAEINAIAKLKKLGYKISK